jgi:hypothetical protein
MTLDPMARLAAANPVTDPPSVEPPERLRCLIEDDAPETHLGAPRRRSSRSRRRALAAVPLAVSASVAGVLLTAGSSGPGVNIAAAAYAAVSPQSGIVEAVFVARILRGSQAGGTLRRRGSEAGGTLRQREWNDAAAGLRREQDTTTGPYGDTRESHVLEMAFAPGRWEVWSSGAEANVITRTRIHSSRLLKFSMAFGGIALNGVEGIELYRQLYRKGWMRLVGHERHEGRSLWKLESRPSGAADANGRRLTVYSRTRLVVLVDPETFLPVSERQIDVALPGHPTLVESNLIRYRRLSPTASEPRLFDLSAQHPGARLLTKTTYPRFVPMRHQRPPAKQRTP